MPPKEAPQNKKKLTLNVNTENCVSLCNDATLEDVVAVPLDNIAPQYCLGKEACVPVLLRSREAARRGGTLTRLLVECTLTGHYAAFLPKSSMQSADTFIWER